MHPSNESTADREIVTQRTINAPRELVWKAWTEPKHLEKWFGPNGFKTTTKQFDFRLGGTWRFTMHGPDGTDYPNKIVYDTIVEPELVVYRHSEGDDAPGETHFISTITFEDLGGKTLLTMRGLFDTAAERDRIVKAAHAIEGAKQTIARLDEYVTTGF